MGIGSGVVTTGPFSLSTLTSLSSLAPNTYPPIHSSIHHARMQPSIHLSMCPSTHPLSIHPPSPSVYPLIYLSIHVSTLPFIHAFIHLPSVYQSIHLSIHPFNHPPSTHLLIPLTCPLGNNYSDVSLSPLSSLLFPSSFIHTPTPDKRKQ